MPVFTNPISNQNTSYSAGVHSFPQIAQCQQYAVLIDEFQRESLQPTNAYLQYTTGGVGTPTFTLAAKNLTLTTTGTSNDNACVRTSGVSISRISRWNLLDTRSQVQMDIIFSINTTTSVQFFVGLVAATATLTTLPTTARHLGVYVDTSVNNIMQLSSSNGTSQVKTSTGKDITALSGNTAFRLNIVWTGNDAAVITLYQETSAGSYDFSTSIKTVTVTAFYAGATIINPELFFFLQTLTTAAATYDINAWRCVVT